MKVAIETLQKNDMPIDIVIHSLALCVYQARIRLGGQDVIVCDCDFKPITRTSLALMCETLQGVPTKSMQLVQPALDKEMIDQPAADRNAMQQLLDAPRAALRCH